MGWERLQAVGSYPDRECGSGQLFTVELMRNVSVGLRSTSVRETLGCSHEPKGRSDVSRRSGHMDVRVASGIANPKPCVLMYGPFDCCGTIIGLALSGSASVVRVYACSSDITRGN